MSWIAVGVGVAGVAAGAASGFLGAGKKPRIPPVPKLNPSQIQMDTIAGNMAALPAAQRLATQTNTLSQQEIARALEFALPGGVKKAQDFISSQLSGELSPEDTRAVIRNATAAGFGSGVQGGGAGSIGRNLTLRDLGRSTVEQKERGLANFANFVEVTRPPVLTASSMFLTPAQRLEAEATNNRMSYDAALAQAGIDAQPSAGQKALSGALGSLSSMAGMFSGSSFANMGSAGAATSGFRAPTSVARGTGSLGTPGRFSFGSNYGGGWM